MSQLIYIVAAGHSGSTLLDMALGTSPAVFTTGELVNLPWQLSRIGLSDPNSPYAGKCSCLQSFQECTAWNRIIKYLSEKIGFDLFQNPYQFIISFLKSPQYRPTEKLRISAIRYLVEFNLKMPFLKKVDCLYEYIYSTPIKNNWFLIDAINYICQTDFVADSSKDFLRLRFLHSYRPDYVYLLVLVRDIRGIAYSNSLRGTDPIQAARRSVRFYNRTYNVIRNIPGLKYLVVEYEELCENPDFTIHRIAEFLGTKSYNIPQILNTHQYHLVGGNPMRFRGNITIKTDQKWEKGLTLEQKSTIEKISRKMNFSHV